MSETSKTQDLATQHKEWKLRATEALHNYGDEQDHCSTFDGILNDVGLPGRDVFVEDEWSEITGDEPVGEDTVEEFEKWKFDTSKFFHQKAREYGINRSYEEALREIGFLGRDELYETVEAVIEGSFSLLLTVEVPKGDDLINHITRPKARDMVQDWVYSPNFTWKARVANSPEESA